jgi:AcrR family transcriptional regulator
MVRKNTETEEILQVNLGSVSFERGATLSDRSHEDTVDGRSHESPADAPPAGDGPPPGGELLDHTHADALLDELITEEMGDEIAAAMRRVRRDQEARYRREHPNEGLRERKRRHTRQTISDVATTLFATRGFDEVTVSEVADRVGVSEKTVYNYFPTKEAMVLDTADEAIDEMARALRDRGPNESLTEAVLRAVEADMRRFDDVSDELLEFMPLFLAMVENTPQLRAAWLELYDRLAEVTREELAAQAGLDPRDPEVGIAARALAGLAQVSLESRVRRILEGLRGAELREAIDSDIERAARLLETGLWSFELLTRGARAARQARDLARSAEQARDQVLSALRQARETWAQVRRERHEPPMQPGHHARRGEAERQRHLRAAQAQQRRIEAAASWAQRLIDAHERHRAMQQRLEGDDPDSPT